jgi:peptidoglycan/xylan/chitin deacetylase (PgdA/CDA1 family)
LSVIVAVARSTVKGSAAAADSVRRWFSRAPWPPIGLVVLLYHRVGRRSELEIDLPLDVFRAQMAELATTARVVSLTDAVARLADSATQRESLVAVTFDDGTADFADVALPVLVEYQVPVTVYVATEFLVRQRQFPHGGTPLTWAALREATSTGLVDVGSHTHTHALLDRLPQVDVAAELDRSCELVQEHVGQVPAHFAYPKAVAPSGAADRMVRARFASAALAGTRVNVYGADPYRLARSPVQYSDGMRWFRHKLAGGLALEDAVRRVVNRGRYAGAAT